MKGDGDPIDVLEIGERVSLILHLHGSVNISRNFRRLLFLIETFSLFFYFFFYFTKQKKRTLEQRMNRPGLSKTLT